MASVELAPVVRLGASVPPRKDTCAFFHNHHVAYRLLLPFTREAASPIPFCARVAAGDWEAMRRQLDSKWTDFRRSVTESHRRFIAWDDARERRLIAHLDEADGALRESAAQDAEVAADLRIEFAGAQQELRQNRGSSPALRCVA